MTKGEAMRIAQEWTLLARSRGQALDGEVASRFARAVEDLDFETVIAFFDRWTATSKLSRAPLPAEVREAIENPVSDEANARAAAALICSAVTRHGYSNGKLAREMIGELGWQVVTEFGGWYQVCSEALSTAYRAQLREVALSVIERARAGRLQTAPALPEPKGNQPKRLEQFQLKSLPGVPAKEKK